tara:strand:- start:2733 stop:3776 length:1044 start_codon:yes stop_codon:yes gene_type:complete
VEPEIKIGKRRIGPKHKPLIIAELGINHNGSLKLAKKIVDVAKKCGAEIIKHQTHIADEEMSEEAKSIIPVHTKKNIFDIIKNSSLSFEQEKKLKQYIEKKKMIFLSTPFSREAARRLNKIKVKAFKIGSGECNNYPLIEEICKYRKPIILSTGMNNINTIKPAVNIIEKYSIPYALMHCTNLYPTPPNLVRLRSIMQLKKHFPRAVLGLSDHTENNFSAYAALGLGVSIIEKHFVDKKTRSGPDISASMDKKDLEQLIKASECIYKALPGNKTPPKEEINTMKFAFASVVANESINAGEKLNSKNIWVKRPGTGDFLAKDIKKLYGKKIYKNVKKNTQISKFHLKK